MRLKTHAEQKYYPVRTIKLNITPESRFLRDPGILDPRKFLGKSRKICLDTDIPLEIFWFMILTT